MFVKFQDLTTINRLNITELAAYRWVFNEKEDRYEVHLDFADIGEMIFECANEDHCDHILEAFDEVCVSFAHFNDGESDVRLNMNYVKAYFPMPSEEGECEVLIDLAHEEGERIVACENEQHRVEILAALDEAVFT